MHVQVVDGLAALRIGVDNDAEAAIRDAALSRELQTELHHLAHHLGRRLQDRGIAVLRDDEEMDRRDGMNVVHREGVLAFADPFFMWNALERRGFGKALRLDLWELPFGKLPVNLTDGV